MIDADSIQQVLDLASDGLTATNSTIGTVERVKKLFSGSKRPSQTDVEAAMQSLRDEVMQAKEANLALRELLYDMREAQLAAEKEKAQWDNYRLVETARGDLVAKYTGAKNKGDPPHFCCPTCLDDGKRGILQGDPYVKTCHRCDRTFRLMEYPEQDSVLTYWKD